MFVLNGTIVYSPTDLAIASDCEYALLRRLDKTLGRGVVEVEADPLMDLAAKLGDRHEVRVLEGFRTAFGPHAPGQPGGVVELPSRNEYTEAGLKAAMDVTLTAISDGANIVYQGAFFDGRFHGRSDFLERIGSKYAVLDTKLARHAKVTALLQLAAYADQLLTCGVAVHDRVALILGNDVRAEQPLAELLAVYRYRRRRLQDVLDTHQADSGPVEWGDPRWGACGRCALCEQQLVETRDVLLVAGMRLSQRAKLQHVGITTVEELAASTGTVDGVGASALSRLRQQATLQAAQDARPTLADGTPVVDHVVIDETPLLALPAPSPGDLFFDFEGDPLWEDENRKPNLEYLFGVMDVHGTFTPFLAHDRAQERQALIDFLAFVRERRLAHPDLRIYHYAAYERTALSRLAGDYTVGEDDVDDLLRNGILVDLYATVRGSVQVSQPSYSIKKLEPLYGFTRTQEVTNAGASMVAYSDYCALKTDGQEVEAAALLQGILDYNEDDCRSTLELLSWLRALVAGKPAVGVDKEPVPPTDPDPTEVALLARAGDPTVSPEDAQAYRMLAAALGYHRREDKPFWWAHFARLKDPIEDWDGTRDVFMTDEVLEVTPWRKLPGKQQASRNVRLAGAWGAGTTGRSKVHAVLADPVPDGTEVPADGCRGTASCDVLEADEIDELGRDVVVIELKVKKGQAQHETLPMALVPQPGPSTKTLIAALVELGQRVLSGGFGDQPGLALLCGLSDADNQPALPQDDDRIVAVTEALRLRDKGCVAVQGPPGTGKTYLGARVVKALVDGGWRVGVVAQSHAVVENFLDEVVVAGVPAARVGKKLNKHQGRWTVVKDSEYASFLSTNADVGCVIGGTTWDLVNTQRIDREQLDLLVIDEAGQFALANALAASVSAKRLLLLGDPQQLPQVSQGTHPEPVNESALSWLLAGEATMPVERGYFLPETWRMHPALCKKVSALSYEDRLFSHEAVTLARSLPELAPGLHAVPVHHTGNATSSPEEAAEIVTQVRALLGMTWNDKDMMQGDLLVVAAYNAQVLEIHDQLTRAGYAGVRVGTVDKLQGQEAAVVLVSLAASSPAEVPRGLGFLLSRNRLNVAVSRGKWASIVVHSPALADHLPSRPEALVELGAYLNLLA